MQKPFPRLHLADWRKTRDSIHKYCQIIGEVRQSLTPHCKHDWHVNLRPDVTGFTTPPIPTGELSGQFSFKLTLDLTAHQLHIHSSDGHLMQIDLTGQSQDMLWHETKSALYFMGIEAIIDESKHDRIPGEYEPKAAANFWQAAGSIAAVFSEFKSGLRQETSPLSLWPHHFDIGFVSFSGRLVPGIDPADAEKADEQIGFGFSTGDEHIADAYVYASAYPMPQKLKETELPEGVIWNEKGWQGAVLMYESVSESLHPKELLLDFMISFHKAGAALMR